MYPDSIHILTVATALPGPPVSNAELAERCGMDQRWQDWVRTTYGADTRYLCTDIATGDARGTLADLGFQAAERALEAAGLDAADLDLLVLGTCTPDMLMPATVNMIADRLGVNDVSAFQLHSGPAGAVQALELAERLLRTGRHRTALVLGGDVCTKQVDFSVDLTALSPAQLQDLVLSGDAGGAAVLSADPVPGSLAIRAIRTECVGRNRAPGRSVEWFGMGDSRTPRDSAVREDTPAIRAAVPAMAGEVLHDLLESTDWGPADIGYVLPPQLSARLAERSTEALNLPAARAVSRVHETGNSGSALPFLQLEQAASQMAPGDRAVGITIEPSKWIKAGFALEKV